MSDTHDGQKPLRSVEADLEAEAILSQRPKGMPPLSVIQTELARMGYPKTDAVEIYDRWLTNGFRTRVGPIRDWKAAIRIQIRNGWLASQRASGKPVYPESQGENFTPPSEAEVMAYAKEKKWTGAYGRWCYLFFVGNDWCYFGRYITSTEQWQALMATELMDRAPR